VIIGKINGVELIAGDGQVFNGGDGEGAENEFTFGKGIGPLFSGLEDLGGETHFSVLSTIVRYYFMTFVPRAM